MGLKVVVNLSQQIWAPREIRVALGMKEIGGSGSAAPGETKTYQSGPGERRQLQSTISFLFQKYPYYRMVSGGCRQSNVAKGVPRRPTLNGPAYLGEHHGKMRDQRETLAFATTSSPSPLGYVLSQVRSKSQGQALLLLFSKLFGQRGVCLGRTVSRPFNTDRRRRRVGFRLDSHQRITTSQDLEFVDCEPWAKSHRGYLCHKKERKQAERRHACSCRRPLGIKRGKADDRANRS
ncbi:hypothetical protein BDM02DRAFT_2800302 [Thelephora ganbajun]|uniref:Uncharacterized protein n=1 Tax=Thelephora ganbajun TaxID=370292 RepID=A0ACB6ZC74_THEGA|nr:hypothetical protein BDM02DRAFT_2800302 [Thelephora ganbajun]